MLSCYILFSTIDPLEPLDPLEPEDPEDPLEPDEPLEPLVPLVPLVPLDAAENVVPPIAREGDDRNVWIWKYPLSAHNYIISADVARGDGGDYSAFHVLDIKNMQQVAEYKGQLGTTDYGNFLIELSTKYNDALLVVENNNIGWATLQTIIDRGYPNLFYMSKDLQVVDVEHQMSNRYRTQDKNSQNGRIYKRKNGKSELREVNRGVICIYLS